MALKDGDIITLDYEGRTEGVLFDTTLEKIATKEDDIDENRDYAPITVVVGESFKISNSAPGTICPLSIRSIYVGI